jgi:hypothetical protein
MAWLRQSNDDDNDNEGFYQEALKMVNVFLHSRYIFTKEGGIYSKEPGT